MKHILPSPAPSDVRPASWARRLGWLFVIWLASVAALGMVAAALRLLMAWAGMTR